MIKVKKEEFDKSQKKTPAPEKKPEINVENKVDLNELSGPINKLVQAVKDSQIPDPTESVIFAIKTTQEESDKKQETFIKYLGEKIDVLVKTLKEKPTSFEFDVERNNNGFIKTVLVKPVK